MTMKLKNRAERTRPAFTLIEVLLVITIIAVVSGLIVGLASLASDKAKRTRVETVKAQLIMAIEAFHAQYGFYPGDNSTDSAVNPLFYELTGARFNGTGYQDIGGTVLDVAVLSNTFHVGGIVHSSDQALPRNFLGLSREQLARDIGGGAYVLAVPVDWPAEVTPPPIAAAPSVNPWRYQSTRPIHNPNSYDLWAEIYIRGNKHVICNWKQ